MMKNLTQKLCFVAMLFTSLNVFSQVPNLSSNPGTPSAPKPTIFLDFDGHTVQSAGWQSGTAFVCQPAAFNATQITEIYNRVSEDYRAFNVNVTTDSSQFIIAPPLRRVRIIVTPTSAWYQGVGGVAYTGSFTWGDDTPAFVFSDRLGNVPKYISECCTHESGHTLGLAHQSRYDSACNLTEQYRGNTGSGQTSWAPVMGNSYYSNMTGWDNGPTPFGCSNSQDNLTILTTQNGFGYRTDDYIETLGNSTTVINSAGFNMQGIITTAADRDAFKFTISQAGFIHFDVNPYSVGPNNEGAGLDTKLLLYNSAKNLIATFDPINLMNVSVDTSLNIGDYYLRVASASNSNTTNYGSIGSYTFSGYRGTLPIRNISLKGYNQKGTHKLNWEIIADEPIASQILEISTNGTDFHSILSDVNGMRNYDYIPSEKNKVFYRLKATNVLNQSLYSNILVLKTDNSSEKLFNVSTMVLDNIVVKATDNFSYNLLDINGRLLQSGKQQKGNSNINVSGLTKGMYVLQMISNDYKQTERIIKQ